MVSGVRHLFLALPHPPMTPHNLFPLTSGAVTFQSAAAPRDSAGEKGTTAEP